MAKERGAPKKPIDWSALDALLQYSPSLTMVAGYFDVSDTHVESQIRAEHNCTFGEYREMKTGKTKIKLLQTALNMAFAKDRVMLIFCLKNLCHWQDRAEISVGEDSKVEVHVK